MPLSGRCVSAPRVSRTVMSWWRPEGQGLGGPVAMPATPSHDEVDGGDGGSWKLEGQIYPRTNPL